MTERRTESGSLQSECPRCHDSGALDPVCELCEGTGHCGMGHAIQWMLEHGKTDPPPDAAWR